MTAPEPFTGHRNPDRHPRDAERGSEHCDEWCTSTHPCPCCREALVAESPCPTCGGTGVAKIDGGEAQGLPCPSGDGDGGLGSAVAPDASPPLPEGDAR